MRIRVRIRDVDGKIGEDNHNTKWTLYNVPGNNTLRKIFDALHNQDLKPRVDLDWADTDSIKYFVASTKKEVPAEDDFMEVACDVSLDDLHEAHFRFFLQLNLSQSKRHSTGICNDNDVEMADIDESPTISIRPPRPPPPKRTILDVLITKPNQYPDMKSSVRMTQNLKQFNVVVQYLIDSKMGVNVANKPDFTRFVEAFAALLWVVDPHYSKFKARGKVFSKIVEEKFLNFNKPENYKNPVKNISSTIIASKVNAVKEYLDRGYMASQRMKMFHDIVQETVDTVMDYFDILEKQRERTMKNSHESVSSEDCDLSEFVVTNLKMNVSTTDRASTDLYKKIRDQISEADVYDPIDLNLIIPDTAPSQKLRKQRSRFIREMLQNGLPFKIPDVLVFHFRLPSQGSHKAIHFLWKQPFSDKTDNAHQNKLVFDLRNKKEVFYNRSMKHDIKTKLLKLGIVKPNEAIYVMKELMGDKSAAETENQREVLGRLQIFMSAGEEIIVDLRKNNGSKPKYEEFWKIVGEHIDEKTAIDDRRHSAAENTSFSTNSIPSTSTNEHSQVYRPGADLPTSRNITNTTNVTFDLASDTNPERSELQANETHAASELLSDSMPATAERSANIIPPTSEPREITTPTYELVPESPSTVIPIASERPMNIAYAMFGSSANTNLPTSEHTANESPVNLLLPENRSPSSSEPSANTKSSNTQSSTRENEVVVNMALALSYADMYRTCLRLAEEKGITAYPSYQWFLMQFWPTNKSTSKLLHYTGRFRVRRAVQARILRKNNPDAQYARTVYKFLKGRAIKYSTETIFFSADAKCKIPVGEPGFPLAAITRGKKVIVGRNEKFKVADHDFSKMSLIPDAVLVHNIPEAGDQLEKGNWYSGAVYYSFKSMVFQGSTAERGVVELGKVIDEQVAGNLKPIPNRCYLLTDGGGDRNVTHLSVQKPLVGLFRKYDFDEIIAIRTAAGLSFYNPVERMHARMNQGLQAVGIMRKSMSNECERSLKKTNSNEEIRKACEKDPQLAQGLKESLKPIIEILKETVPRLSMPKNKFQLYEPASNDEISSFSNFYDVFDKDIDNLRAKNKIDRFPKFKSFMETHTSLRSYSFHIFKCQDDSCPFHKPLQGTLPEKFPDPVPVQKEDGSISYVEGSDPQEKFVPSKQEDATKRSHNVPFPPNAQTARNVGLTIKCEDCAKPRLLYSKKKTSATQIDAFKRYTNDFVYLCGSSLQEITDSSPDGKNKDAYIENVVYTRENLDCNSKIEIPYYAVGNHEAICIYCGNSEVVHGKYGRSPDVYPKCMACDGKEDIKKMKRKTISHEELRKGAKIQKH